MLICENKSSNMISTTKDKKRLEEYIGTCVAKEV